MGLPWDYCGSATGILESLHDTALGLPWDSRGFVILPWYLLQDCHETLLGLPWGFRGTAMGLLLWGCYRFMALPNHGTAMASRACGRLTCDRHGLPRDAI